MKKVLLNVALGAAALSAFPMMASAAPAQGNGHGTTTLGIAQPTFKIKANNVSPNSTVAMTPSAMKSAYGVNLLSQTGSGKTIAIVDAYGSPTVQNDLNTFDAQYGLPNTTVSIAQPGGAPSTDGGWALETSLDVEWAHALAPQAKILLVEAKSSSIADLVTAIDYATNHGAVVVSNSWGGGEWSGETSYESHFQHSGVVYVASSGDTGAAREWPAVSPSVLSVGGTSLSTSGNTYLSESAWSSGGGGTSSYFGRPSYQNGVSGVVGSYRGVPDVSMDADPNSGALVYDSTPDNGSTGWFQVGGTSLAAPMWAALVALTDQSRSSNLSYTTAINDLYTFYGNSTNYANDFHDITSGSNGYAAKTGYDMATGIGSPKANNLIPAWASAQ